MACAGAVMGMMKGLSEKLPEPFLPVKGATGFGVRLLVDYLESRSGDER